MLFRVKLRENAVDIRVLGETVAGKQPIVLVFDERNAAHAVRSGSRRGLTIGIRRNPQRLIRSADVGHVRKRWLRNAERDKPLARDVLIREL